MAKFQNNSRNNATPVQQAVAATFKTMVEIGAVATVQVSRGQIYEIEVGADGAPNATDCQIVYDISRITATGTGVASVPNPLNPADSVSKVLSKINDTVEPTTTAASSVLALSLNQRASQRWIAAPGSELIWPATAGNGLALRALSPTYASNVLCTILYDDL